MKWIGPLFSNAGGWEAFVAVESGKWFLDKSSPVEIGTGKTGLMLLPMLQKEYGGGYKTQIQILEGGLLENDQDPELAYEFPFEVPVLTAYQSMPNWCDFALNWLKYINLDQDLALKIFDACQNLTIHQDIRQATIKYINQWSMARGFQFLEAKR